MKNANTRDGRGTARWKCRPEGSTWGDFGADDQVGRLNLLTPRKVLQGLAEVRDGKTFCLSLPLDVPGGTALNEKRHPPILRPTLRNGRPNMNYPMQDERSCFTDVICDDLAILHLQYSTQWDSLAHIGQMFDADGDGVAEPVFYNGYRAGLDIKGPQSAAGAGTPANTALDSTSYAQALGIEHMAEHCVQGRAVLIDLYARLGRQRQAVGYDALMRVMDQDRIIIEAGDIICLHTGFAQALLSQDRHPDLQMLNAVGAELDGRDARLLNWITDSGVAAVVADNLAVEALPATAGEGSHAALPLHAHCLFKLGAPLGELWHLTPLADYLRLQGRSRFLLTAPPLRLPGAVGSPVTPIATV